MRCPNCNSLDTQVKDSRPTEDSSVIRRRRVCVACNFRFTTFERVQLRELTVIKRNGRRVPFDRDKLMRSVQISLRKRQVEPERVEKMVSTIVRELETEVQRLVIQAEPDEQIGAELVSARIRQVEGLVLGAATAKGTLREMVDQVERQILLETLREHGNNKTATAKTLGITREGLHKKLKQLGIG